MSPDEAQEYELAALRDQIDRLKVMHLSAESELMMSEAHVERLTSANQYQANLLGNAYGAVADWSDLPSDTRPAKAIEHLGRRVEHLTAELAEKNTLIERCMSMAHVTALFSGGRGEGDPYVGFREILQHNTELIERNDELIERNDKGWAEVSRHLKALVYAQDRIGRLDVRLAAAEAREKKLRAITGEMSPHPRVWDDAWSNCCAEWDRRAGGIV